MSQKYFSDCLRNPDNWLVGGKVLGIGAIGIFAGQALGFSTFLMPALRKFAAASSLAVWCESYHPAAFSQMTCIAISSLCLGGVYYKTKTRPYLYAGLAMVSILPYTFGFLMPINKELLSIRKSGIVPSDHVEALLMRWDSLHVVRTFISMAAFGTALFTAVGGCGGGLRK